MSSRNGAEAPRRSLRPSVLRVFFSESDVYSSMLDSPAEWEAAWERNLKEVWGSSADDETKPTSSFAVDLPTERMVRHWSTEKALLDIQDQSRNISILQQSLATDVASKSAWDHFEENWRALTESRRREVVVEGIHKGVKLWRLFRELILCPELTVDNLCSGNGETFLEYLQLILATDLGGPLKAPQKIPNKRVDQYLSIDAEHAQKPGYRGFSTLLETMRTRCITLVFREILCVFYQDPYFALPTKVIKASHERVREDTELSVKTFQWMGYSEEEAREKVRSSPSYMGESCHSCGKPADKEHGVTLSCCAKCKKIGRLVRYCSRECQLEDWKSGTPRPHKHFCGRPLDEGILEPPPVKAKEPTEEELLFPEPSPGFKRSPALIYQLNFLRQHRGQGDYMIFPEKSCGRGILVMNMFVYPDNLDFNACRYRAFQSGDQTSVKQLYVYLCQLAGPARIPPRVVRAQMEKEYPGVPLDAIDVSGLHYSEEVYARVDAFLERKGHGIQCDHPERHASDDRRVVISGSGGKRHQH